MGDGGGGARTDLRSFEGQVIDDRYLLTEWVGGGAFGAVFLSEQRILGRPVRRVACKISRETGMTEEDARHRFSDVLRLAEAMDGMTDAEARRHLVHVYDGGLARDAGGRAFLVMEYVPGTTLADQFSSRRTVSAKQLFLWARQICVALRGLHALDQPLLHRDLKPDNVLLGTDLTVRLIDFGLAARLLESGTVPGVAGTLTYMAPETSQGESVPASDLYSLGVLMYEGLTGRHPYEHLVPPPELPDALHGDWLYRRKRDGRAPAPPSRLNNTVTREIDAVVLRCLEFDPVRRFRSATELLDALAEAEAGPRRPPPGANALERAREQAAAGDPAGACDTLRACLDSGAENPSPAVRLALLHELAGLLDTRGDPAGAARRLAESWQLVRASALLRTRRERHALLTRTADAYRRAGNGYQARHFEDLLRRENDRG
ncbi:serine/threonine-protein kinase [Streptomyces griseiscabiei]|uniref:non-specific serine/threonine protein kinase n=1 Tax=Streptomyces griseiscabiei TaxID=2993540 RepID=A0ABU4KYY7_9ACTN|nr:serine/threonine-protein kinase [Streptomyces griseiscabiei]MBZ3904800.1 serine/threonine protein kinase [Streptomyces griseiscabiei]MDX2908553.1 serine/threonine-protein kinase [Streptomyces griseiscabiei]